MGGVSLVAAFGAGLLSFLSPCVLPLVPGYISMVSGASVEELKLGDQNRLLVLGGTVRGQNYIDDI